MPFDCCCTEAFLEVMFRGRCMSLEQSVQIWLVHEQFVSDFGHSIEEGSRFERKVILNDAMMCGEITVGRMK